MPALTTGVRRKIKIAFSLILVAGLIYFLDTDSLAAALADIDVGYLLIALVMVIGNRMLMPFKWNLLLRARDIQVPHFQALRIYTIASFLGLVLPPTVGADSIRSYYMKKSGVKLSDTVASIVIERIFGLVVLLVFTIAGFFLLVNMLRDGEIQTAAFAGALTFLSVSLIAGLYVSFSRHIQKIVVAITAKLKDTRLKKLALGADSFVRAYQEYNHKKSILVIFCLLTAAELTLVVVRSYIVALSLGVDLSLIVYFAFLPLVTLLNRLPISFDGFGINEVLFIYFLGLFGVLYEPAFLIGLINHLLFIVAILPGGIFYVFSDRDESHPVHEE